MEGKIFKDETVETESLGGRMVVVINILTVQPTKTVKHKNQKSVVYFEESI